MRNESSLLPRVIVFLNFIHSYVQTIRYRKEEADTEEDGNTETKWVNVEKQTTPDRLERVPFDADASWELLK